MMQAAGDTSMLVPLHQATVARLLEMRLSPQESVEDVVRRISNSSATSTRNGLDKAEPTPQSSLGGKYACTVFGERRHAATLALLFAAVVDVIDELDSRALDRLATRRARKRAYISRNKTEIHPGRPDLPLHQTKSGWWISGNIGADDLVRGLKALCSVASLEYGHDICLDRRVDRAKRNAHHRNVERQC